MPDTPIKLHPDSVHSQGLVFEPFGYERGEIHMRVYYFDDYPSEVGEARGYLSGEIIEVSGVGWVRQILESWEEMEDREPLWRAARAIQRERDGD